MEAAAVGLPAVVVVVVLVEVLLAAFDFSALDFDFDFVWNVVEEVAAQWLGLLLAEGETEALALPASWKTLVALKICRTTLTTRRLPCACPDW